MADIELIFKINEKDYDDILNGETKASALNYSIFNAIRNGTPLPKGHGRLIDENDLSLMTVHLIDGVLVCDAPTIIEADKPESEDTE